MEARAGLMAGDDRYLPARDQGPAKAFVRDYIDRKRRLSEYFIFIAVRHPCWSPLSAIRRCRTWCRWCGSSSRA